MDTNFFRKYSNIIAEAEQTRVNEAYLSSSKDVIELLASIRKQSKMAERGQGDPVSPNQLVNDLWDVITWIESNIKEESIEANEASPAADPASGQPPAQPAVDPKVATGAQAVGQKLGAKGSGQMVAKGLDKVSQGQAVSGTMSQAIAPFVEPLEKILADPSLKQKFLNLIKQVQQ
jgi:hypothetical protein